MVLIGAPEIDRAMTTPRSSFIHGILSSSLVQALAGPNPEDRNGLDALIGVAQKVVAERFDSKADSKRERDMLDVFIAHGLTQLEAESESSLQILAGSDSTATTVRVTLLYLLTNHTAYLRLRAEMIQLWQTAESFPLSLPIRKHPISHISKPISRKA
jgi:cytochrome P450